MALALLLIAQATAGGYFYSDSGIVATGRGGAWVAGADTQFAQHYNPAGLIRIDRPAFNIGWSGVQQNVTFRRLRDSPAPGEDPFFPEASNQAAPFSVPQIGFATPIGDRVSVALGFYSPFAPSSLYDEEGPQRYSIKDTLIYQFSVGPSVAVQPHDLIVIGMGLQWQYLQVGETIDVTLSGIDDPTGDIAVEARVVDPFTPNLNAGLLLLPDEPVTIGFSVQPPTKFTARGQGTLDFTGTGIEPLLNTSAYVDDDVALNLDLPWVLRTGVAVRPVPQVEVEAAVVWQGWSALQDIVIEDIDITVDSDSPLVPEDQRQVDDTIALPAGLRDTVSLRLGGEWRALPELELRAGGFWENAALAPDEVSVALVDTPKVQLGGGASVFLLEQQLRFDLAAAVLLFKDLEIRNSTVTQIDAGVFDDTVPLTVGNGDLSSSGWILGLQGQWWFGAVEAE